MRLKLLGSVALSALALGVVSASAGPNDNLSQTIGNPVINQMSAFEGGNWINRAINNNDINGSVNIVAVPNFNSTTEIEGSLDIGVDIAGSGAVVILPVVSASGAIEAGLDVGVELEISQTTSIGGAVVNSTAEIKTVAAGAVNTGDIASAASATSTSASINAAIDVEDLTYLDGTVAQSASNTSNTAAEAFAADGTYFGVGGLGVDLGVEIAQSASGPALGVYAVNEAFNSAYINGSVNILSNGTNLAGIGTTAAGAVNTGTISMGFDGSAFSGSSN